jgi:hypothetical protein
MQRIAASPGNGSFGAFCDFDAAAPRRPQTRHNRPLQRGGACSFDRDTLLIGDFG